MSVALLDVNVLLALHWRPHAFHSAAMKWFGQYEKDGWATCSLTQAGFVRVLSNPAFDKMAPPPAGAIELLKSSTEANPHHRFWTDTLPLSSITGALRSRIQGPNQITDAYLLALSMHNNGRLVTFDYRMQSLAPPGSPELAALHVLRP